MKLRDKISICVVAALVIATFAPGGSVLSDIAQEHVWDRGEIGLLGVLAVVWFAVHGVLIFRETEFYGKWRRPILWSIGITPVVVGALMLGVAVYQENQRDEYVAELRRERAKIEAVAARKKAVAARKKAVCESLSADEKLTPFCEAYLRDKKVAADLRLEIAKERLLKDLLPVWDNFLLKNRDKKWVRVVRSINRGDYVCLDVSAGGLPIGSLSRRSITQTQVDLIYGQMDSVADAFVNHLNEFKIGNIHWEYADLSRMKLYLRSPINCMGPSGLFRVNRYAKRLP